MKWGVIRSRVALALALSASVLELAHAFRPHRWTFERKNAMRELTRDLWNHGFRAYMDNAFPMDELQPLACRGRGPNWFDPSAVQYNDVLANCSVTLVDNIDTFVIMNNPSGFQEAVKDVIHHVSFDVDTKPQVFETTIRVLGGLLSAHIFSSEESYGFAIPGYKSELLKLAHDLGRRLLPAFDTPTGIPYARINLRSGVPRGESVETCSAGAGSLLLEFATLSRLTGDARFETAATRAFYGIWNRRSGIGLIGNTINIITGSWTSPHTSGIGAGIDSFFEYALKMHILTGESQYLDVWNDAYSQIMKYSRGHDGFWYRGVEMDTGELASANVDSLSAFWPGLQVLAGDIESAIKSHMAYWNLWNRFSGIPETFNVFTRQGVSLGYPLRPEFIESTYFLYRATRDPFYLDVGDRILEDLGRRAKVPCGLSTISNLLTNEKEDRMESFTLSESLKYLYLLFDEANMFNADSSNFVFTTEAHMLILNSTHLRSPPRIGRILRRSSQPVCLAYVAPLVALNYTRGPATNKPMQHIEGLIGTVRERVDFEYARLLSGISLNPEDSFGRFGFSPDGAKSLAVVSDEDMMWWNPDGWCEVPKVEEYTFEWVLSSDGSPVNEDHAPGPDKVREVSDGYMILNITGVRIQVTARIDRTGYDITRLGQHRVFTGQKVHINDPAIVALHFPKATAKADSPAQSLTPDIRLVFSFVSRLPAPEYINSMNPNLLSSSNQAGLGQGAFPLESVSPTDKEPAAKNDDIVKMVVETVASTASFGGNPALLRTSPSAPPVPDPQSQRPLLFGPESPLNGVIRVVRAAIENMDGCDDHAPDLRIYPPIPNDGGSERRLHAVSVLFVRRGGCTFVRKLFAAKEAGFAGVIVWNDVSGEPEAVGSGGLLNPTVDNREEEFAKRELNDVAIVVITKDSGALVDAMLARAIASEGEGGGKVVVVEVKVDDIAARLPVKDAAEGGTSEPQEPGGTEPRAHMLFINGLALLNTIMVF